MFKRLFCAALVFGAAALAPPAMGQSACSLRTSVIERLETQFSESLKAIGLRSSQSIVEVWVSDASGTWTILVTDGHGISCVIAAGTNWESRFTPHKDNSDPQS